MLDSKLYTFLCLFETLNYHKTADKLNMTQPAVSQHIKYLENVHKNKLFIYENRKLYKTKFAEILYKYAKAMLKLEIDFKNENIDELQIKIGATKTVGEFLFNKNLATIIRDNPDVKITYTIENTKKLLEKLDNFDIDIAIIEGFFDKSKYEFTLLKNEKFLGICNKNHRFAGKEIDILDVLKENILIREKGSGSLDIFMNVLRAKNYSFNDFKVSTNSLNVILHLISQNIGITFAYKTVCDDNLTTFKIKGLDTTREFNYVYLKNTSEIIKNIVIKN